MCTFDPKYAAHSMAPDLTAAERSTYVREEILKVREMLDGAEDCKWIYQSLISLSKLYRDLGNDWIEKEDPIENYIVELTKLDSLRAGRWNDLRSRTA